MQLTWLALAIVCTVGYHLVLKLTPAGVNPLLSLLVTYALVTALFGAILLVTPGGFEWKQEVRQINWTALALAAVIVGLDLGFLFLYRSGFEVSLGALVTQSAAAMLSRRSASRCLARNCRLLTRQGSCSASLGCGLCTEGKTLAPSSMRAWRGSSNGYFFSFSSPTRHGIEEHLDPVQQLVAVGPGHLFVQSLHAVFLGRWVSNRARAAPRAAASCRASRLLPRASGAAAPDRVASDTRDRECGGARGSVGPGSKVLGRHRGTCSGGK